MKTKREVKDALMAETYAISGDLVRIFGEHGPEHIADIGACDGLSSIAYAKMFPRTMIHAMEPRTDNFNEMQENIKEYGFEDRIIPIKTALGQTEGEVRFFVSEGQAPKVKTWNTGNKSSSIYPPLHHLKVHPWCNFKISKCHMMQLDDLLLPPFNIMPFDFIHIDVQGAELDVFKGGKEALSYAMAVWCEVSNIELYKGQPMKAEIVDYMDKHDFMVSKDTCELKCGDCLFEREPTSIIKRKSSW
jgi:FkbM family methyltransferase